MTDLTTKLYFHLNILTKILFSLIVFSSIVFNSFVVVEAKGVDTLKFIGTATTENVCDTFGGCLPGTQGYAGADGQDTIAKLAINITNLLIFIGGAVAVLVIVLGGYKYLSANGDESEVKKGKSMVINALIGLAIAILSFTLVTVVSNLITTLNISS